MFGRADYSKNPNVLVVDDEGPVLRAMARDLRILGYHAVTSSSSDVALAMLRMRGFDAVVADLNLPLGDGGLFVEHAVRSRPGVPVVVVTGEARSREVSQKLGCVPVEAIVHKPYRRAVLGGAVEAAVARERTGEHLLRDPSSRTLAERVVSELKLSGCEDEHTLRRLCHWTQLLASEAGLRDEAIEQCALGALMHDVGMLGVPRSIREKRGPVGELAWTQIRSHPSYGRELLASIPSVLGATDIIYCHHERWDGKGYPRGLAGEEIPIEARIFAVVDAFDAMTRATPYREAMSVSATIDELQEQKERSYDPEVVDMLIRCTEQDDWLDYQDTEPRQPSIKDEPEQALH
ncbi:MAG: HD domain-containing phosphohydrolase [Myxococcota bacterium]